jgi:hypothetical protein
MALLQGLTWFYIIYEMCLCNITRQSMSLHCYKHQAVMDNNYFIIYSFIYKQIYLYEINIKLY